MAEFERHGAVAIRLGLLVGMVVDAREASSDLNISKSLRAGWNSTQTMDEIMNVISEFPATYPSVQYDENTATITTTASNIRTLGQRLKNAGFTSLELEIYGRFHAECHDASMNPIKEFCNMNPDFHLPDASKTLGPTRTNTQGTLLTQGSLYHHALDSILTKTAEWHQTLGAVRQSLWEKNSILVSFGFNRCVPLTHMCALENRVVHLADIEDSIVPVSKSQRGITDNDIAVIGMSCKVAGANSLEEFWDLLCAAKSQHREVPQDRIAFEKTAFRDFDHKFFKKSPKESATMDPQQRLLLQIAYQAVEHSGYFCSPNLDKRGFVAGKVSHYFGWTGPGLTIDTACFSSAVAVHQACRTIIGGECTAVLAGGTHVMTSPLWFQNLAGASFLSTTGQCKPFDAKADGYCRGEGMGVVFLKKLSSATADGDQILGVVAGTAVQQNQNCTPIFVPNVPSLSSLFSEVTKTARLTPGEISVVEAHGTGTAVGDLAEYDSIRQVLGGPVRSSPLAISWVKGLVGHVKCTSSIILMIKVLLMMNKGAIPAQASFTTMNPAIKATPADSMVVPTSLLPWKADFRAALINNYGASGSNASMVITESPLAARHKTNTDLLSKPSYPGQNYPVWLCGPDDQSLRRYTKALTTYLTDDLPNDSSIAGIAYISGRPEAETGRLPKQGQFHHIYERVVPRPIVLCFDGQVSKYVGLDRYFSVIEQILANLSAGATDGSKVASFACYNGPKSLTLAGLEAAIDAVGEAVAKMPKTTNAARVKKLNVTNAVHCAFVDPLTASLEKEAQDLTFREPKVPIERATEFSTPGKFTADFVPDHMRQPVFFELALQRLAQRKALGNPSGSHFQAVNITSDHGWNNLVNATVGLWKVGLPVQFRAHSAIQSSKHTPLFLPPYQFDDSRHWLELKTLSQPTTIIEAPKVEAIEGKLPDTLLTFLGYKDGENRLARFRVNTTIPLYEKFVVGHVIAQTAPICPSIVQLDLVVEAVRSISPEIVAASLEPQIHLVENQSPLYINASRHVLIEVEEGTQGSEKSWGFQIFSVDGSNGSGKSLHTTGRLEFRAADDVSLKLEFARLERFMNHQKYTEMMSSGDVDEILSHRNICNFFSEIVEYSDEYRGLQKLVAHGSHSAGYVTRKKKTLSGSVDDAFMTEAICQIGGIYTQKGDTQPEAYHVLASHYRASDKTFLTDMFAYDVNDGSIVGAILGVSFVKVARLTMQKLLTRLEPAINAKSSTIGVASPDLSVALEMPVNKSLQPTLPPMTLQLPKLPKSKKSPPKSDVTEKVREILAELSGLELHEIKPDSMLPDLGIDSLMGMEMAHEIEGAFKIALPESELMEIIDIPSLIKCVQRAVGVEVAHVDGGGYASDGEESSSGKSDDRQSVTSSSHGPSTGRTTPREESELELGSELELSFATVMEAFNETKAFTDARIAEYGQANYVDTVMPLQTKMCIALTLEAFEELGVVLVRQAIIDQYVRQFTHGFDDIVEDAPISSAATRDPSSGSHVIITGGTGSLGSHLIETIASRADVAGVICLNRRSKLEMSTRDRQLQALEQKGINLPQGTLDKVRVFETDLSKPRLDLSDEEYDYILDKTTHIIHNAWLMNAKWPVTRFEPQLQIMRNLLNVAGIISSRQPAGQKEKTTFQFVSSIATVGYRPLWTGNPCVREERMSLESVLPTGYGDAKYTCELMLDATLHHHPGRFRAMVVRPGQIAGSSASGHWIPMEHVSFLCRSSQTLEALPDLSGPLSWTPVDTVAATLGDLLVEEGPYPVYHIDNPIRQPWQETLSTLASAMDIPWENVIPLREWIRRVMEHTKNIEAREHEGDNPTILLINFLEDNFVGMSCGGLLLDTAKARQHSAALASCGPVREDLVRLYVRSWREMGFLW
ncbi:hypothetical protein F4678DRAFT_468269 [Xylaria arbuscula]|nr:hypothetical protein F4678DRAFT_468269 [Xylaria arbuscula]